MCARSGGKRIVGAVFDSNVRATADEQALKWRGVGLAPKVLWFEPAIESLVVDPNANDGGERGFGAAALGRVAR